jgi:hypothetical protein
MDVKVRAENITAHIGDPALRSRVKGNLTKFLATLDAIPDDDEVFPEATEQSWRDDGSDGVPLLTLDDISAREKTRLTNLRDLHEDLTRADDGDTDTAVAEVEVRVDINELGKGGKTALHRAVIAGDLDLVSDLLSRGARKDIEDRAGMTALDRALFRADDSVTAGRIAALLSA